jgi:hypothetical protein
LQAVARPEEGVMPLWADGPDSDSLHADVDETAAQAGFVDEAAAEAPLVLATPVEPTWEVDEEFDEVAPVEPAEVVAAPYHAANDGDDDGGDDGADELVLDDAVASLADRLALARESAGQAMQSEARGHKALYEAIGRAWDFARAISEAPSDFAELVDEAGLTVSPRSPLTAVAKLVFGASYDKTRLAEITTALRHAERQQLDPADLTRRIATHAGGLKGLVKAERAASRPAGSDERPSRTDLAMQKLREAAPMARIVGLPADDAEFVVLVARRDADGLATVVARLSAEQGEQVIAKLG